jgi:UDPglucose 6-dehydrogenase
MHLLVIGTGYVGLVTGACLAEMGHHVICLDLDAKKIAGLQQGIIPFFEPGLEELVKRNTVAGRLSFTTDYAYGVENSSVCFIAVPTPSLEDGSCDLSYVLQATRSIAAVMTSYHIIAVKSTVPVGTSQKIRETMATSVPCDIVSNPEFLKEGSAVLDCMKPDRIILGADSPQAEKTMRELFSAFNLNHDRVLVMDTSSAEMTKYVANAMLASRISFMNEMAALCEQFHADITQVRRGIGSDRRIGHDFLYAGAGFGGSCFPKDIRALQAMARSAEVPTPLLSAIATVNENQKKLLAKKMRRYFSRHGGLTKKTVAIWGLSFKPDTDDIREAPALYLIEELLSHGAHLRLFDPIAMPSARAVLTHPHITWCESEYHAAIGADAIALLTEWKQFRFVDAKTLLKTMRGKAFFDGRNQYKKGEMKGHGFHYHGIGIPEDDQEFA